MSSGLDDFDNLAARDTPDAEGDDAPEGTERKIGVFPDPDLLSCPVTPLGFLGRKVVFAMPEGEIRIEDAAKIPSMLRVDIFACAAGQAFLTTWRDSEDKFQRDLAAIWFVRKCRAAKLYDVTRAVRGLGVWPGEGGAVVLHRGSELVEVDLAGKARIVPIAEAMRRPGPLYRLRPQAPMPMGKFSGVDGQWVRDQLDSWRFQPIGEEGLTGADIVFGWIGGAMLGAVAPFRAHLLLHALAGAGKTTLMFFLQGVMSALSGEVISKFSEPGLRADLSGNARPVHIDEAESRADSPGGGAVAVAMELLRDMATGQGANRKSGSIDGSGNSATQTAIGAVAMAAINPVRLTPQDVTRVVEVKVLPVGHDGARVASSAELQAMLDRAKELAPALLGRALRSASRYRHDVDMIKEALTREGQQPRAADLIAMLAAGRRLLLYDAPLTADEAVEEVAWWSPLLTEREATGKVSNPGADAMAHLLAWDSGVHSRDRRTTLGELLEHEIVPGERGNHIAVLKAHGLLVQWHGGGLGVQPYLVVANNHPGLERIYKTSAWPDWTRALEHLNVLGEEYRTRVTDNSFRFGAGRKQRGLMIPLTPWFDKLDGAGGTGAGTGGVPGEDVDWNEK